MFTGIIRKTSKVIGVNHRKGGFFVEIKIPSGWGIKSGDSVSINGVCSTVKDAKNKNFVVEYMPETIKRTTVQNFKKDTLVNLEKSLRLNDLVDGHLVQGHIDCPGKIISIEKIKESKIMRIRLPEEFTKFIAPKGSVAVDGVSLTIVEAKENWFSVSLVSYTLENTNLGILTPGSRVNVETDVIAKYLNKLLNQRYAKKKNNGGKNR